MNESSNYVCILCVSWYFCLSILTSLCVDPTEPSVAARLGKLGYSYNMKDGKFTSTFPHVEAYRGLAIIAYEQGGK